MTPSLYSPEETARRGRAIYERALRAQLEPNHQGEVVAIDINTEAHEVAGDVLAACEKLLARVPDAEIWVVRIGQAAVYHLGWRGGARGGRRESLGSSSLTADAADDTQWRHAAYEQFCRDDAPEGAVYDTQSERSR